MSGPFKFVFSIIWVAIGLSTLGTLKDCTMQMAGLAARSQQHDVLSLKALNRSVVGDSHDRR
jgi:hypothetical protein